MPGRRGSRAGVFAAPVSLLIGGVNVGDEDDAGNVSEAVGAPPPSVPRPSPFDRVGGCDCNDVMVTRSIRRPSILLMASSL